MIPYDDLVAALSAWRARQGLPVSTLGAPPSRPTPLPTPTPAPRTAPPAAPPSRAKAASIPPPLAQPDLDVEDAAMLEETAYENEGADFALGFAGESEGESTAIGSPPPRDSITTDPVGVPASRGRRRGNDDW